MQVENNSGLKPVGRAVLVQPYQPERKKGLIELPDFVEKNQQMVDTRCVVVECGPAAWREEIEAGYGPRAQVGDKVLVSQFAGYMAVGTADNKQYRFVNDKDIFAKIEVENNG